MAQSLFMSANDPAAQGLQPRTTSIHAMFGGASRELFSLRTGDRELPYAKPPAPQPAPGERFDAQGRIIERLGKFKDEHYRYEGKDTFVTVERDYAIDHYKLVDGKKVRHNTNGPASIANYTSQGSQRQEFYIDGKEVVLMGPPRLGSTQGVTIRPLSKNAL